MLMEQYRKAASKPFDESILAIFAKSSWRSEALKIVTV